MAIRSFAVGPLRGLQAASAEDLGNLVVLAGPNGAGKSTILDLLRQQRKQWAEPGTKVMFVGPHRTWRSSSINQAALAGYGPRSYGELLSSDNLPSFQYSVPTGMQGLQGTARDSSSAEDAPAFVKVTLSRLRDRQKSLVTDTWEANGGQLTPGQVPNLFKPFEELIATLLPHLEFAGVDDSDPNNIQVRFRATGAAGSEFDIDQLSSGEKAAIALLLPLVEGQSEQLISPESVPSGLVPLTMLLDEPEIHLHPLLQLQVLEYFRSLASAGTAQFILSTHSTTLLDALNGDELYLVSPAAISPDNQLSRLTLSEERLELARDLTGSTHILTRAKPIVFLEGEEDRPGVSSDARILLNLVPSAKSWALVPGRSKIEVATAVRRLRQDGVELPGTPVFGIVDSDSDGAPGDDHVIAWPVAMVENLLLDANAVMEVLSPFGAQTTAASSAHVTEILMAEANALVDDEIRLRVQRQIPVGRLTIRPSEIPTADEAAEGQKVAWLAKVHEMDIPSIEALARREVREIVATGSQLERFHGKKILQGAYRSLGVAHSGLGQAAFALLLSSSAAGAARAALFAAPAIAQIRLYFPPGLPELLRASGDQSIAESLANRCANQRQLWEEGNPTSVERNELRSELFAFARLLPDAPRLLLANLASQVGTP